MAWRQKWDAIRNKESEEEEEQQQQRQRRLLTGKEEEENNTSNNNKKATTTTTTTRTTIDYTNNDNLYEYPSKKTLVPPGSGYPSLEPLGKTTL